MIRIRSFSRFAAVLVVALLIAVPTFAARGRADFSRFVAIGDSYGAGVESNSLNVNHQPFSWPAVVARQVGATTFQQPLVSPLYNGQSEIDLLAGLLGEGEKGAFTHLREFWQGRTAGGAPAFEQSWQRWVSDGVVPKSATPAEKATPRWEAIAAAAQGAARAPAAAADALEADFALDGRLYDGRFANNAWLQEMPDPITRLSWDNAALMGMGTMART